MGNTNILTNRKVTQRPIHMMPSRARYPELCVFIRYGVNTYRLYPLINMTAYKQMALVTVAHLIVTRACHAPLVPTLCTYKFYIQRLQLFGASHNSGIDNHP
jgi:hypothetical protein